MWEGKQIGPFAIEKEIGAGAMGTVYRAIYTKTQKRVAVKVVSVDLQKNPKALARFERETLILKRLDHRNIVKLYTSGHAGNRPFYAMEYIDGETLENVLHRRNRHTWEEVIRLGQQICAALQHAHAQGVVHRDLKPANIMITRDGTVKLTDFGIAKGFDLEQLTATNAAIGTAAYMSPEQCKGDRNLSHRSDLYSLGVLLYELLVGKRPFQAETTLDMYMRHVEGKFERPSRIVLDIPIWLDTLVCQLLEKDPAKRPFDAATVATALNSIQEKVEARRSAGVDVVTGRAGGKQRSASALDDTDAEAARTLKDAVTRKKRKRKPLISGTAFQAVGYILILAALGGLGWWFTRPPAAEGLHAQAKKMFATGDYDKKQAAREGPIEQFFKYYGRSNDPRLSEMQTMADDADLALKERQLRNRMKRGLTPNSELESKATDGVKLEEAGDLDAAKKLWTDMERHASSKDPDLRPWGLLAAKYRRALADVEKTWNELHSKVTQPAPGGQPYKPASEPERLAAEAKRYEITGSHDRALGKWKDLKEKYEKDPEQRRWFLLGAYGAFKIPALKAGLEARTRAEVIRKALDIAKALDPRSETARAIYKEIVDSHGNETDDMEMMKLVKEAREMLAKPPMP